ncbi:hypothetical protein TNIN_99751 [Trichonephila inaurata madagascariensis]|uniref:Uncharacterized protein n=1 Tax=Trichonephila inaurata madagascariensis TaxID=2747483 RepID=A0A8X6YI06_9ARAC|nr:hypothetical protein TNIN_99751 [Trichonephila inaurata madagascariensis]
MLPDPCELKYQVNKPKERLTTFVRSDDAVDTCSGTQLSASTMRKLGKIDLNCLIPSTSSEVATTHRRKMPSD